MKTSDVRHTIMKADVDQANNALNLLIRIESIDDGHGFDYFDTFIVFNKRMVMVKMGSTAYWYDFPNGMTFSNMMEDRYLPDMCKRHYEYIKERKNEQA